VCINIKYVFSRYLTNHIPSLDVLPVRASIVLAGKNIVIADVTFQANDRYM